MKMSQLINVVNYYFKKTIVPILACISLFLSIQLHNHGYSYIYFIQSLFILTSLIICVCYISHKKTITFPVNNFIIFYALFLLWATLSCIWSPVFTSSILSVLKFYLIPTTILISFWSSPKQQQYFQYCLIFLLLIIAWKAGQQSFLSIPKLPAPGFFSNKNTNASFISMISLPLCAQFLSAKTSKTRQTIYGILLFLATVIIALTLSRGAVLGLTIGLVLLGLHTLSHKNPFKPFIKLLAYLSAGYLSTDIINGAANWSRLNTNTLSGNINAISSGRDFLWSSGWQMYLDQPVFGWGLNTFHLIFPQYRQSPDLGQYVHNDYFQFLIELGPVGFILFLGFVLTFLFSAKKLYQLSTDKDEQLYSLGLIAACVSVLTHSIFTFNLYQPAPLLLLGLYIGVLTQRLNKLTHNTTISFQPSTVISSFGYYSLLSVLTLTLIYLASINIISLSKVYNYHKNNLIALEESEKAYQLTSYNAYILAKQLSLYKDLLYNQENKIDAKGRKFLIDRGIKVSEIAIKKNPYLHINYINTAKLYLLTSEKDHPDKINKIKSVFDQAIIVNPFNLNSRLEYIKVLMQLNEKQKAIEIFSGALGRKYYGYYKDPIYYLQLFLALISHSGTEKEINSIKQQLDKLIKNKGAYDHYMLLALESNKEPNVNQ